MPSPTALAVTKYLVSLNYMLVFVAEFLCQLGCFCSPPFGEGLEETRYSAADCTLFSRRGKACFSQKSASTGSFQGLGIFCVSSPTPSLSIASLGRAHFSCHLVGGEKIHKSSWGQLFKSAGCPYFSLQLPVSITSVEALLGFVLLMEGYSSLPYVF